MILYISNLLSAHGIKPQPSEFLIPRLKQLTSIEGTSTRFNPVIRCIDQLNSIRKNRKNTYLIILDVYAYKGFYATFLISLFIRFLRIPYITYLHSSLLADKFIHGNTLLKYILAGSRISLIPSTFFSGYLKEWKLPYLVFPNCIDETLYTFKPRNELRPRLLWIRSFQHIYNPQLAIQVLQRLQMLYPDAHLTMAGDKLDNSYDKCVSLIRDLGIEKSITLLPMLSKEQINTIAQEHDIFLNTTFHDHAPVTLIEAGAMGLPIVSTNPDGIPHIWVNKENALLVPVNDYVAMTNAVVELLLSPDLVKKVCNGALQVSEKSFWRNMKQEWKLLIKRYT